MAWPIPQPDDIIDRAAGVLESEYARVYALRNPGAPPIQPDARSPNSLLAVDARVTGEVIFDGYVYQANLSRELMPDTAQDWLSRHAAIRGIPQGQPIAASGSVIAVGVAGLVIPTDFTATAPGQVVYQTTADGTIAAGQTAVSVPMAAAVAGAAGNLASGVVLTPVSPLGGLASLTTDPNGLTGGQDLEPIESWRARILQRWRQPPSGGDATDWVGWAQAALPGCIAAATTPGPGLVTVAIAMPGTTVPIAPTTAQLATVQAYIGNAIARKPLGITPTAIAATLTPINWTIHLNPDTPAIRTAAQNALLLWFDEDATGAFGATSSGLTLDISRGDAALSTADGEFSHDRTAPTADYVAGPTELPILGTVTFV